MLPSTALVRSQQVGNHYTSRSCAFTLAFFAVFLVGSSLGCTYHHKDFHICINVFTERDFGTIQSYFEMFHMHGARRRNFIMLEGPTLDEICGYVLELEMCIEYQVQDCFGKYDMEPINRLLSGLRALRTLLCSGNKQPMIELLTFGGCIEAYRKQVPCHQTGIAWPIIWMKIFRLEVGNSVCPQMIQHMKCILNYLPNSPCEPQAADIYNLTMSTWLDAWCGAQTVYSNRLLMAFTFFLVTFSAFSNIVPL